MGKKQVSHLNPKFDPRMLTIGSPVLIDPKTGKQIPNKLRRGWIVTDGNSNVDKWQGKGRVNFLYNPSQVTVAHSANTNRASKGFATELKQKGLGSTGTWALSPLGTVSLSLLFDRTYELWGKPDPANLATKYGVYADVLGFYQMFGMVTSNSYDLAGTGGNVLTELSLFPEQPMAYPIVYIYLGADGMVFHGAVAEFDITYTHWSRDMIPMRCEVDITINMTPDNGKMNANPGTTITNPNPNANTKGATKSHVPANNRRNGMQLGF